MAVGVRAALDDARDDLAVRPEDLAQVVVGPDPRRAGLFWATGLGGHGLTTSRALGLLVGELLAGEASPGAFDPARFSTARATS